NTEDDDAARPVRPSVSAGASHLPLGPDVVARNGAPNHLDVDVRDEREDLLPIPANLSSAPKAAGWMCRRLVLVVLGKACCQGLEIMLVRRAHQPIDRRERFLQAVPPLFRSSMLEPMERRRRNSLIADRKRSSHGATRRAHAHSPPPPP